MSLLEVAGCLTCFILGPTNTHILCLVVFFKPSAFFEMILILVNLFDCSLSLAYIIVTVENKTFPEHWIIYSKWFVPMLSALLYFKSLKSFSYIEFLSYWLKFFRCLLLNKQCQGGVSWVQILSTLESFCYTEFLFNW